ncbi:MAG: thioredoxin domain-containing protein [Pseudomonadota bacterium]
MKNGLRLFLVCIFCGFSAHVSTAESTISISHDFLLGVGIETSNETKKRVKREFQAKGENYKPRTKFLYADGSPRYINRLIFEDSPYLIQHAHNPVNWYPWGEAAFQAARESSKPIFLSIGYSTCHWCHVMEHESFENEDIARILNRDYIAIKVDREQRPDVDATFMRAVTLISGGGGWPMSSFLTSDGKPFFGGTYFPPERFTVLLNRITDAWRTQKPRLTEQSVRLSAAVSNSLEVQGKARTVGEKDYAVAVERILGRFDAEHGGFGLAPKFPQEPYLFLLLENARRNGDAQSLRSVDFTLQKMADGGIHDQIGGGFHRYAVDRSWRVPHFEKMLYNQAALARIYLSAFELTGNRAHAEVGKRVLNYVVREMTSPQGGFYSATDADSEGEEGRFFVWTPAQIAKILNPEDARIAEAVWGISEEESFEGHNILRVAKPMDELAADLNLPMTELKARIVHIGEELRVARNLREHPLRDEKNIVEWNGMMITAMAEGSRVLKNSEYLDVATKAADWLWSMSKQADGQFHRMHFNGRSSIPANQLDFAYFAEAMLALYDVDGDLKWLERAQTLADQMIEQYWDAANGGFYMGKVLVGGARLPTRPKDIHDGATPSGNSVAMRVLTKLWYRTGDDRYRRQASKLLAAFSGSLAHSQDAFSYMLIGAGELLWGEVGTLVQAARGNVSARIESFTDNTVSVVVDIDEGWHINAHEPIQDYLIGTHVEGALIDEQRGVVYPQPITRTLGFQREALALYEHSLRIDVPIDQKKYDRSALLTLKLQACNDEVCLAPESLKLFIAHPSSYL